MTFRAACGRSRLVLTRCESPFVHMVAPKKETNAAAIFRMGDMVADLVDVAR